MPKAKELEARLERVDKQLRLCQKLSRLMARQQSLQDALQAMVSLAAEFMRADSCLLYVLSRGELVLCAAKGTYPGAVGEVTLRLDEGLTGWVARERRVLAISREAYHDPRFKFFRDLPEDTFEAFLSAPVLARNRVIGVINLQHRQPHPHSGDEIEMIATIGEQIGCLTALSALQDEQLDAANFAEAVLPVRPVGREP